MNARSILLLVFLTAPAAHAQAFWIEDFDAPNDQSAIRDVLGFPDANGGFCGNDYFVRTNLNGGDFLDFNGNFTNLSNDYYWRAEDFDSCSPTTGDIDWTGIDISGRTNIVFRGRFGVRPDTLWESTDFLRVRWSIDGGSFVDGLCFAGGGGAGSDFTVDADCNGVGDAAGLELTEALADFGSTIGASGSLLDLRVQTNTDAGGEEMAFDFFRLEEALFVDGFESGDATAWSASVP